MNAAGRAMEGAGFRPPGTHNESSIGRRMVGDQVTY